ncbi:hypothetical protein [Novosphingobium sp.]|uniref:hypothetical protein n=1 Tax=Novosphingobium sp. TaxID=1874826 RepID=UPI0025DFD6F9|nr:hypothetical protein [Novosphingobium sp.]
MNRNADGPMVVPSFQTDRDAIDFIDNQLELMIRIADERKIDPKLGVALSRALDVITILGG